MTSREKTIDRVLAAAQSRFGLGTVEGPGWIRDRVGTFLDAFAAKNGYFWEEVEDRILDDADSMNQLIASLRVGETRFFRDPQQFNAVAQHVCATVMPGVPIRRSPRGAAPARRRTRWPSCSPSGGRKCQVLGVDRSSEAIETAKKGWYPLEAVRDVPKLMLRRHFEESDNGVLVRAPLRASVAFRARDLVSRVPRGPFHVVLFRNVLLYLPRGWAHRWR